MQKQNSTFLVLIIVALVITIPLAYSAVEPSIIINMIGGQTEKPLQIKDSGGSEVFSVDVDGTIFPPVASFLSLSAGTEEVVLSNLYDTITNTNPVSDGAGQIDCWGVEFTLPQTSDWWKITAFEVKSGDTSTSSVFQAWVTTLFIDQFPLSPVDFMRGTIVAHDFDFTTTLSANTVLKIPVRHSEFIAGGTELVVEIEGSINSDVSGRTSSGVSWNQTNCFNESVSAEVGEFSTISTKLESNEYYVVVYATPYT